MGVIRNLIHDFKITNDDIPRIETALFYDGPDQRKNLERFATLMFFATAIATYGVIADSTATVIGAMLIAPLMTPILAIATGIVTGQMPRAGRAFLTVLGGVAIAVGLSLILGWTYRSGVISVTTNTQIISRTSPRLVDLWAALFAGAAGAFAISRKDVADTLPGAAIAIALVPPLAVVGVALSQGAWSDAWGAMLLFMTNFFAILLAGGSILALIGLRKAGLSDLHGTARKRAAALVYVGAILVIIPLASTSMGALNSAQMQRTARTITEEWLVGSTYEVNRVANTSSGVTILVSGEGDLPEGSELVAAMTDQFDREMTVVLEIIPAHSEEFEIVPVDTTK